MKFNVKLEDKKLQRKFKQDIRNRGKHLKIALGRTAEFLIDNIQQRTQRGKSASNKPFLPYTKAYREFRKQEGKKTKPDLNFSGKMLANMTQRVTGRSAIIKFADTKQALKALGNQQKRKFFAIGNRRNNINKVFSMEYKKLSKLI
jgi:hypothetical protein